jgi:hypothetical protein
MSMNRPELTAVGGGVRLSPNGVVPLRRVGLGPAVVTAGVRDRPGTGLKRLGLMHRLAQSRWNGIQVMSQCQGGSCHMADGPAQQSRDARLAAEVIPLRRI